MNDPYLSWHRPDVARGMYDLTAGELQDESHPPYKYFLMAMDEMKRCITFPPAPCSVRVIDAGCGVGHYGYLIRKHYPNIVYVGLDFSKAMVQQARNSYPELVFLEEDAKTFDYSPYDIVLASSLIEVMDQWDEGAEAICKTAHAFVVLHRVRVWSLSTERTEPEGYPNQPTYAWIHNEAELLTFFSVRHFPVIWTKYWDESIGGPYTMATYIFRRM